MANITEASSIPQIAAIICTHNRQAYLGAAIDSLLRQDWGEFEVLVVDNGSTDSTRQVVASRLPHPRLRYVYEPILGLSVARNRGAKETSAPLLAYLDDDAIASPQWLRVLVKAYAENEKLGIAGGKISLIWPDGVKSPNWLSDNLAGGLGAYDLGDLPISIKQAGLTPRGLNYSIRRDFLTQVGGFDTKLGRVGNKLLSNEELYMTELALQRGWQVAYLPEALVAHHVAPERLKPSWFLRRSWWQGVSECYREKVAGRTGIAQLGRGGERLGRGIYKSLKYLHNPALCFDNLAYTYGQVGYLSAAIAGLWAGEAGEFPSRSE